MRIAQVCPYSLSVPGGVQGQVLGLGRALRRMGHEVRVLAPCDGPPPDPMVTPLGRSIPTAVNGSVAPVAPDPACALRTIHTLRNERFDVLHLHEPIVPGPCMTSLVTSDAPMVGTFHAAGGSTAYSHVPWVSRRLAKRLALRVAVSADARATAERNLAGDYDILWNGIEIDSFEAARTTPRSAEPTVLFLGRHEERKGLAILIEAVQHQPGNFHLVIGGIGPQTSELQSMHRGNPRIEWLGKISDAERLRRLGEASVFCAPSLEGESFGIVLLEGMAAQIPVVASDLPGYRNVARPEVDSLLVPPGDPLALAAALQRVIEDAALAQRLITAGYERAHEFTMDRLAEEYVERYQRVLARR